MTMKILLLQAREPDDKARAEERTSFAEKAGLPVDAIVPHDLLFGVPTLSEVQGYDALMIGGSGEYYVSKGNLPYFQETLDLLAAVVTAGHPTFASCFGFQLLTEALGGQIIYDAEGMQVGTYDLTLTEAGREDNLFRYLPDLFRAQLGRKDKAVRLPDTVVSLATNVSCPFMAFRVPRKLIWATQFHPELTGEENRLRFSRYLEGYQAILTQDGSEETLSRFGESPETAGLIARFLKLISGQKANAGL